MPNLTTPPSRSLRPAAYLRDQNEHLGIDPVHPRVALRMLLRSAVLRCPACGGGPVIVNWLKMRDACGNCGLRIERGEPDYFIGSMTFNLVLAELLFITVFIAAVVCQWPNVNWDVLQVGAALGMVVAPAVLFPFSKLTWLAFDLIFRPDTDHEVF